MLRVPLSRCREGVVLAEDVYDWEGRLLLAAGTSCGSRQYEAITNRGIDEIPVTLPHETDRIRGHTIPMDVELALYETARKYLPRMEALPSNEEERVQMRRSLYEAILPIAQTILERNHLEAAGATGGRSLFIAPRSISCLDHSCYEHAKNVSLAAMVVASDYFNQSKQVLSEIVKAGVAGLLHDCGDRGRYDVNISSEESGKGSSEADHNNHPLQGKERTAALFRDPENEIVRAVGEHEDYQKGLNDPRWKAVERMSPHGQILAAIESFFAVMEKVVTGPNQGPGWHLIRMNWEAGRVYSARVVQIMNYRICPFPPGSIARQSDGTFHLIETIGNALKRPERIRLYAEGPDLIRFGETIPNVPAQVRSFTLEEGGRRTVSWIGLQEPGLLDCLEWELVPIEPLLKHYGIII